MEDLLFHVEGNPEPWQVYTRRGEPTQAFERRKAWQAQIQAQAKRVWAIEGGHQEPFTGLVELSMVFYLPWPKSPKRIVNGGVAVTPESRNVLLGQKPDLTNLFKAAEDALKGIIIKDDSQVVATWASKVYDGRRIGGLKIWIKFL